MPQFINLCTLVLGRKGNLTLDKRALFVSLAMAVPSALGFFFFLYWQTYV